MPTHPLLIVAGTNRPGSNTLKVAKLIQSHYTAHGIETDFYSLEQLPREIFDPASYGQKPAAFQTVQQRIVGARGLHVVTPEYNGGPPGVLKYFVDMLKFPESFERKPVAFTGLAAGLWGALRPVEQLQMIFAYRNAYLFPERVFIPTVGGKLTPEGKLTDETIDKLLVQQAKGFDAFIRKMES